MLKLPILQKNKSFYNLRLFYFWNLGNLGPGEKNIYVRACWAKKFSFFKLLKIHYFVKFIYLIYSIYIPNLCIDNKKIVFYSWFADDSCLIIKKTAIKTFMNEINNFDKLSNFTFTKMSEKCITFLDMTSFIDTNDILKLKKTVIISLTLFWQIWNNQFRAQNIKKAQYSQICIVNLTPVAPKKNF